MSEALIPAWLLVWIAAHPAAAAWLVAIGHGGWQLLELWLGRTDKTDSGSTMELVWNGFWKVWNKLHAKVTGLPVEGVAVGFNTKTVKNCTEVEMLGNYIDKLGVDGFSGNTANIATDVMAGVTLYPQLSQLGPDYAADPVAVEQTIERALDQVARSWIAALREKHAPGK